MSSLLAQTAKGPALEDFSGSKKDSALDMAVLGPFRPVRSDDDSDREDDDPDTSFEALILKMNKSLPHRGPNAKAKPRKKGVDDIEAINRKLVNVSLDLEDTAGRSSSQECSSFSPNDPINVRYLLPAHAAAVIGALGSDVAEYNLAAIKQLRRFMCLDEVPDKTERVLSLSILPLLKRFLVESTDSIQYETCWVITNIAAGLSEHTKSIYEAGMVEPLIGLLSSRSEQVRVQAAWALGNIAGDCKTFTQMLLDKGIMSPLLHIPTMTTYNYKKDCQALHVVCWVIANLCRWDNKDWGQIQPAFPLLTDTVMNCRDDDVLSEAIWALSRIFHGRHACISTLVSPRLCTRLVHLLQSPRVSIQTPVLRVMTNISGDTDPTHTQILLESGILFAISTILQFRPNYNNQVVTEVLHCLSNITAGTTLQKEAVSMAGLFGPVRELLADPDYKIRKEACHVLRNAVDRDATPEHFRDVVGPQGEIFAPLTAFLNDTHADAEAKLQAVEALNIIFSRGDEPLIRALYPFAAGPSASTEPLPSSAGASGLSTPTVNVYVSCMHNLGPRNFENIWSAWLRANNGGSNTRSGSAGVSLPTVEGLEADTDELTPLLYQVSMTANAAKEIASAQGGPDGGSADVTLAEMIEKQKAAAAALVADRRKKRRFVEDLRMMLETYLVAFSHTKQAAAVQPSSAVAKPAILNPAVDNNDEM
ncbi:armadillo-type protein [Zopfochytrium polystomum]|nr:armadillo-type protein [Zopfochytrium polystomum]